MPVHPLAGRRLPAGEATPIAPLLDAYFAPPDTPPPVAFGTSGHRGTSNDGSYTEAHILAICQAVADYRRGAGVDGPLFLGRDTHALSEPAYATALEVFAGNGIEVVVDDHSPYTPTPVVSHAILSHNRGRRAELADGVVLTPSHNPPEDGGIKYNPPSGGPAGSDVTGAIERRANELLRGGVRGVRRGAPAPRPAPLARAYVDGLGEVVDLEAVRAGGVRMGVDPMGGATVDYWDLVAERYGLELEVVSRALDPSFAFMRVDRDGRVRMDCSSPYAMAGLVELGGRFDVAFGSDPDGDRHGIVTPGAGLMNPNHYLAVAVDHLFRHRPAWSDAAGVGKTLVSSSMIDRVAAALGRRLVEVPVGFKWFVDPLLDGGVAFAGEESAGATLLRRDGTPWTTDKDGIALCLLAAEVAARAGRDPGELYAALEERHGRAVYERIDAPADAREKAALAALAQEDVAAETLAGEAIVARLTRAPGNGAPIGGLKVVTENGWFAARPSGTEAVYKIYAESFRGEAHLRAIQTEAREIVGAALGVGG